MTPQELNLIRTSSEAINQDPDGFSATFYETVFELAPSARSLFPDDLHDQKAKLVNELRFMISAATASADPDQLAAFVTRTRALGRRHVGYGVTPEMYEPVGGALIATLRETAEVFSEEHALAWSKLYQMVAETMLEGASNNTEPVFPIPDGSHACQRYATTIRVAAQ